MASLLMRGRQILPIDGLVDPVLEPEALSQRQASHRLETDEHRVLAHLAMSDLPIAVLPVGVGEHLVGLSRLPEVDVIERRQPLFHVLDVFKDHHISILSNQGRSQQLLGGIP